MEEKNGFVLLPRQWVVERTFGWLGRFRCLARDYERLAKTCGALHWFAFFVPVLQKIEAWGPQQALDCVDFHALNPGIVFIEAPASYGFNRSPSCNQTPIVR